MVWIPLFIIALIATGCFNQIEPGDSGPPKGSNPVSWSVNRIALEASDFFLEADFVRFLGNETMMVNGDPGHDAYRTLELEWWEHDADMRLYIYFQSDGVEWWSDEIRTYDGTVDDGTRWVFYYGDFFRTPVGDTFVGDIDITPSESDNGVSGRLYFADMSLYAFP